MRRFEDWAIDLRREDLLATGLRLAALYVLTVSVILILFFVILSSQVQTGVDTGEALAAYKASINRAAHAMVQSSMLIIIGAVLIVCAGGLLLTSFALRRIREVTQMQSRFIAETSHEMRTPLSIMKTGIEVSLLNKDALTREEAVEILESNLQEVNKITRMMNALLILSRLDDPARSMSYEHVNITDIVYRAASRYENAAIAKSISIHLSSAPEFHMRGNKSNLETMFKQILRNAVAYTPHGGEIWVRIDPAFPKRVRVSVEDTGVGIPPEKLPHIFEPFYRAKDNHEMLSSPAPSPNPHLQKPLGLGLALAKRIVKQHSGTIRIASLPQKGTTLFITLPLA